MKSDVSFKYKLESITFLQVMRMPALTKVTSKGQVVIPAEIRKALGLEEGSQIVVSRLGELVLMRKISIPDPKKEFEKLTKFGEAFARKKGIKSEAEVAARIHKGRGVKGA